MSLAAVAVAVAGYGLHGTATVLPRSPLVPDEWSELVSRVRHQRLAGLLDRAVADGAFPVTEEQRAQSHDLAVSAVTSVLTLESATLAVLALLQGAGVRVRVLKGPSVAHLDYEAPELRQFSDIDLLVHPSTFDHGVAVMQAAGCTRRFPEPRPGFDRRFSKGTSFVTPEGIEVDYHRVFVMGPYGLRLPAEQLWTAPRTFPLGGQVVEALDDDLRFLHACYHAALGNIVPRLVPQRDVLQMLQGGALDHDRVRRTAAVWGAEPVVARGLAVAHRTFEVEPASDLARWGLAHVPDARARRDLGVYSDPAGDYAGKSLAALLAIGSWRDRAAYTYALALPDRHYLQERGSTEGARLRRGLAAARRVWRAS